MAVVVVIPSANALPPAFVSQSCLLGNFGEAAVAIVAIELGMGAPRSAVDRRTVGDENIVKSVAIIVEDSCAIASGFQDVLLSCAAAIGVGNAESGGWGNIGEFDLERVGNSERSEQRKPDNNA